MRSFLVTLAIGVALLAALGLAQRRDLVYAAGVPPRSPAVTLAPGQRACFGPLEVPGGASFDRVRLFPEAPLEVTVASGGRTLASGRAGARLSEVDDPGPVEVCARNAGAAPVALLGSASVASRAELTLDDAPVDADVALRLERTDGPSLLGTLPAAARRAALFGPLSPALLGIVVLVAVGGAAALVAVAVRPRG